MSGADEILQARVAERAATKAIVAVDDEIDRELVEALMAACEKALGVVDYLDLERDSNARDGGGDIMLIACAKLADPVVGFIQDARERHSGRPIVLLSPRASDGDVHQAFAAGVDDLVGVPAHADPAAVPAAAEQLVFAIEKALARRRGTATGARQRTGRMICVLGLKGGCGKTLVTSNLGASLASLGHSVALVDLDLQFGDLGLSMGLSPERTSYDLMRSGGSLDAEKLDDFLITHHSGARVLLAPVRPEHAGAVSPEFFRAVERVLREMHEFVVIDTPPAFTPEVITAIDASSDVLMVANLDSLALKNTKLGLETLERMEYDRRRVRLVLNRANTDVGINREDLMGILGSDVDARVPSHRDITRSVNRGEPIALNGRSEAAKVFHQLARLYLDQVSSANGHARTSPRRRSVLLRRGR